MIALLWVGSVVVRLHTWGDERSLVSFTAPEAFHLPAAANRAVATSVALDDVYAAVTLPALPTQMVASAARSFRHPPVEFLRVTKEVRILDEAFSEELDERPAGEWRPLQGSTEVPTQGPVELKAVHVGDMESTNFVALMDAVKLPHEEGTMVAEAKAEEGAAPAPEVPATAVADAVNLTQAKSQDVVSAEPEFFEYEAKPEVEKVAVEAPTVEPQVPSPPDEYSPPEGWDLPVGTQRAMADSPKTPQAEEGITTFSYTVPTGLPSKSLPKVAMGTQKAPSAKASVNTHNVDKADKHDGGEEGFTKKADAKKKLETGEAAVAEIVLSPLSVGMTKTSPLRNFEVRAKDDDAETWQDHGEGTVLWREEVVPGTHSRGATVLRKDHVPTHVDIPVLQGSGQVEIPVLTMQKLESFSRRPRQVPVGFVLVDLDEQTETVEIDGVKPTVTKLDSNFRKTKGEDHRYLLFSGVETGNRTLTALLGDGRRARRVIHVHEEEMTFDPGLFSRDERLSVTLRQEDLLSNEPTPLVVPAEQAKLFFDGTVAQKTAPDRYAFRPAPRFLGSRHYLSLSHLEEEIYVGVDRDGEVDVPSEELMREVIRRFKLSSGSQSCVVQVNLDRPAKSYRVLAESHDQAHVSFGLVLDKDGKFYDSLGENSRRLFLMSESQGGARQSENARLNIRLEYQDGTFRSFQTYCSPHAYLVEQL